MRTSALLLLVCVAGAEDLLTPGEQVQRELAAALGAQDHERTVLLLAEVGGLCRYPASPAEAQALVRLAGEASRAKEPTVVVAALAALAKSGMRQAAPHVEKFLRGAKPPKGQERIALAAVHAAGRLRVAELVPDLLKLAQKSSDLTVADQAFDALGEFCRSERALRKQVTEKVLSACNSLRRQRARWRRLRAPGLRALQRLMNRRLNSVPHFQDWWKAVKDRKDPFAPP